MIKRWIGIIQHELPTIDLVDIKSEVDPIAPRKIQFAPQYSTFAYNIMLEQEEAIGDYSSDRNIDNQIEDYARQQMVLLIEELHALKHYKIETLYLAVNIADKYLV